MSTDSIEAEYAEAANTGIEPANTPLGAVRKHHGASLHATVRIHGRGRMARCVGRFPLALVV